MAGYLILDFPQQTQKNTRMLTLHGLMLFFNRTIFLNFLLVCFKNRLTLFIFIHLFVHGVLNFSSQQVTKDPHSRRLLQHHSSMALSGMDKKSEGQTSKTLSYQYESL